MRLINQLAPAGKKEFLARLLDGTGTNRMLGRLPSWSGLLVLNYHRIGNPDACPFDRNLFSATADRLEQQIRLYQKQADIVGVSDLDDVFTARTGKFVLITFDDGYRDNYELAFPVLKACRAKATFFLASGFIDSPVVAWWDEIAWMMRQSKQSTVLLPKWFERPLSIFENTATQYPSVAISTAVRTYWKLPATETEDFLNDLAESTGSGRAPSDLAKDLWVTWEMVQEMLAAGQEIGGHTVNHPVLAQCGEDHQRQEIIENRQRIQEKTGVAPTAFSYPVGQPHMFTGTTEKLLDEAGYRWAFSFYGQYSGLQLVNRFNLPRCAVDFGQSEAIFHSRLTLPQLFSRK